MFFLKLHDLLLQSSCIEFSFSFFPLFFNVLQLYFRVLLQFVLVHFCDSLSPLLSCLLFLLLRCQQLALELNIFLLVRVESPKHFLNHLHDLGVFEVNLNVHSCLNQHLSQRFGLHLDIDRSQQLDRTYDLLHFLVKLRVLDIFGYLNQIHNLFLRESKLLPHLM